MLELPHTLAGIAIASIIPQPLISIPLAIGSHFLLDYVPHWDPDVKHTQPFTYLLLFVDSFSALVIGSAIAWHFQSWNMLLCAFAAVLPDLISIPYVFFKKRHIAKRIIDWQSHFHNNASIIPGTLSQLVVIILSIYILYL